MKRNIPIRILAQMMHRTAMQINPDKLIKLLCLIESDDEKRQITKRLDSKRTLQLIAVLDSALCDYGQWTEPKRMQKCRADNKRQIALFEHYLNISVPVGLPENMLQDIFKADDDETDDEILEIPKAELLEKGYREMDLDLYVAACSLNYARVEELLSSGANPEVYFGGDSTAAEYAHREVECKIDIVYPILTGETECKECSEEFTLIEYAAYDKLVNMYRKAGHNIT